MLRHRHRAPGEIGSRRRRPLAGQGAQDPGAPGKYRLNARWCSPLANAAWAELASEFLEANKASRPAIWRSSTPSSPRAGARLPRNPSPPTWPPGPRTSRWSRRRPRRLVLSAGLDVQHDRVECSFRGRSTPTEVAMVLSHGSYGGVPVTTRRRRRSTRCSARHGRTPLAARCASTRPRSTRATAPGRRRSTTSAPRLSRRIFAIKGASGSRPPFTPLGGRQALWIVGVDGLKSQIHRRLERGGSIRFGADLGAEYYNQIASERVVLRYHKGAAVREFRRVPGRRAEGLDCLVYALAVRHGVDVNLDAREAELASRAAPTLPPRVARSSWMERGAAF